MRVDGKVAIVTGGAGGLGAAAARMLAREGATVVVTDMAEDKAQAVADDFGGVGMAHDVTSEEAWQSVVDAVIATHGRIDVLAHCAGIEGDRENGGMKTSLAEWNKVLAVNLTSNFLGCKAVMEPMKAAGSGSIVLLSSAVALLAAKNGIAYGATKAGVVALSRAFAAIGWSDGARVRCNAVLPGPIRTPMTDRLFADLARKAGQSLEEMEAGLGIPLGARGEPDDIANAIVFLASDDSHYMSGTQLLVDGGWTVVEEP